jgi:hypothetical protein
MKTRLWTLSALIGLLGLSGMLWLYIHFARSEESLPSLWEAWSLKLHGGLAILALVLLGTILDDHILEGLRSRRNRQAGLLLLGAFAILAVSGYGCYYFDGDLLRAANSWTHRIAGVLALPVLVWHVRRGRASASP